ncbi:MAG: hypothetical protein ACXWUQ_01360 [Allosphingosinicella sp.]
MRELTFEELEYISGGEDEGEEIVVTGTRYPNYVAPWGTGGGGGSPPYAPPPYYGGGGGGYPPAPPPPPPPIDEDSHDTQVNLDESTLTEDEKKALADFMASVARVDAWIQALPDNAELTLDNGQVVTGAEVKAAWAKTDFVINPAGTNYANNSYRGESNYNGGDPVVSINIDILNGYNNHVGGSDHLVMHEIAHLTADQRSNLSNVTNDGNGYTPAESAAHERMANDIARAVAVWNGGNVNATADYSASHPTFQVPAPPPPPPTGGGGGGGGYTPPMPE